jgi:hypothetical protein
MTCSEASVRLKGKVHRLFSYRRLLSRVCRKCQLPSPPAHHALPLPALPPVGPALVGGGGAGRNGTGPPPVRPDAALAAVPAEGVAEVADMNSRSSTMPLREGPALEEPISEGGAAVEVEAGAGWGAELAEGAVAKELALGAASEAAWLGPCGTRGASASLPSREAGGAVCGGRGGVYPVMLKPFPSQKSRG